MEQRELKKMQTASFAEKMVKFPLLQYITAPSEIEEDMIIEAYS